MDELNIKAILKAGESLTVEFKSSFGRETIESLVALSVVKIEKFIAQVNECG
jgi:predicted HTH transcriptional regulator